MINQFLFGSRLLKLDNCRDYDYVHFDTDEVVRIEGEHHINHNSYHVESVFRNIRDSKTKLLSNNFIIINYFYQFSKCFHPEPDYPLQCDIRNIKEGWITLLKRHINDSEAEKRYTENTDILRKNFYHIAYQYFMIVDNAIYLEGEHKQIVQKIHDKEMPVAYFQELKQLINAL